MAGSLYLKKHEFPDLFQSLNKLADLMKVRSGVRPSVRKLSAAILQQESSKRIADLETEIQLASAG